MEDFVKSLKAFLYDRTSNPFFANFIFAWVTWNWRIVYATFFVEAYEFEPLTKLHFIEREYINWYDNLAIPFLIACFLTLLMPLFFNRLIIPRTEKYLNERASLRLQARKEKPYSKEKVNDLMDELAQSKTKYVDIQNDLEEANQQLIDFQNQIRAEQNKSNKHEQSYQKIRLDHDRLNNDLNDLRSDIGKLQSNNKELEAQKRKLEKDLESVKTEIEKRDIKKFKLEDVLADKSIIDTFWEIYVSSSSADSFEQEHLDRLYEIGLIGFKNHVAGKYPILTPFGERIIELMKTSFSKSGW